MLPHAALKLRFIGMSDILNSINWNLQVYAKWKESWLSVVREAAKARFQENCAAKRVFRFIIWIWWTDVCLDGISKRKGKPRSDIPWKEPEHDDEEFIRFIKNYNSQSRPQVMALLEKYSYKHIIVFKRRNEASVFLSKTPLSSDKMK